MDGDQGVAAKGAHPRMNAERHQQVKAVFIEVCELEGDALWARLRDLCGDDDDLLDEVRSLLGHHVDTPLIEEVARDPLGAVGKELDDRYVVESFVAEGGFGYVYRGQQVRWQRPVALKFFKTMPGHDDVVRDAFVKEGALLAELSRKTTTIVQSHDLSTYVSADDKRHLYSVMEWLDGVTLADHCRRRPGPMPLPDVIALLRPVAEGLSVAHQSGVAHRDVKPGNIFLLDEGGAKLLDFGVAKVAADHEGGFAATAGNLTAFTVGYAAPEQASRQLGSTGPWTDVFALALVATELLVGRRIAPADDAKEALAILLAPNQRPTPRGFDVDVSDAVEDVFQNALALHPDDRYPDAGLFLQALEAALQSPPLSTWSRLTGWLRR